jgi:hypothetical protein
MHEGACDFSSSLQVTLEVLDPQIGVPQSQPSGRSDVTVHVPIKPRVVGVVTSMGKRTEANPYENTLRHMKNTFRHMTRISQ